MQQGNGMPSNSNSDSTFIKEILLAWYFAVSAWMFLEFDSGNSLDQLWRSLKD